MANFNRVILIGNLCADPVVRYIGSGTAVCDLRLAINRTWFDKASNTKKEETTFVDVTMWGRDAEVAGEYLAKGKPVMIEGRLKQETWDDKATGQKRSKISVVGESMQFLGSPGAAGGAPRQGGQSAGQGGGRRQQQQPASSNSDYGGSQEYDESSNFGGGSSGGSQGGGGGSGPPDDDVPF